MFYSLSLNFKKDLFFFFLNYQKKLFFIIIFASKLLEKKNSLQSLKFKVKKWK